MCYVQWVARDYSSHKNKILKFMHRIAKHNNEIHGDSPIVALIVSQRLGERYKKAKLFVL